MHLACGQDKANRIAQRVDACADLCAQAAARTPDRLIFAPPFAPAACWCARTMVESVIGYSKSGFSTNALKMRSQTPFLAHRRKALEYAVPVTKLFRQIARRCAGASQPQHGIDKQPIVLAMSTFVAILTRNKPFNALPLRVRKFSPNQDRPPQLRS
jgi:hypothetical protein